KISLLGRQPPPQPKDLSPQELQSMLHLGELVRTEGPVVTNYRNSGGAGAFLAGKKDNYRIFIPRAPGQDYPNLQSVRLGDAVRVTGIALQYCPAPPFNSGFQLLVASVPDLIPVEHPSPNLPQPVIGGAIAVIL